jgi:signal transduction histidine kinase
MSEKADILVVDDEPMNVELLQAILESNGYNVLTACDGFEAMHILAKTKVDLVLLDVLMPHMDGYEVTRRIRSQKKTMGLPLILITALHESEERIKGIDAGCDDFLTKPFAKNEVLARIRTLLRLNFYRSQINEKEKFEHLIQRMNDGLIVCDSRLAITRSNRKGCELMGSDDLSPGWLDRLKQTFTCDHQGDLKKDLCAGDLDFDMVRAETPSAPGRILWFSSSLVKDTDGNADSMVIVLHDVTEQRRDQSEKENFLSLMSHKLGTPLAVSMGHLAMLQKSTAAIENKPFKKSLDITVDRVAEFLRMIEKIFDFVAVNAPKRRGAADDRGKTIHMEEVEALVKTIIKKQPDKKVECRFDLRSGLGLGISEHSLGVLLKNLIENSIKFNDEEVTKLVFASSMDSGKVKFSVSDNGPGIHHDELTNVFDTFYQSGKRSRGTDQDLGLGLGLSIAKKIVESADGEIKAHAHADGGASISITLPMAAA